MFLFSLLSTVVLALGIWGYWRYKNRRLISMSNKISGPPTVPLFGNALRFMCQSEDLTNIIKQILMDYGDVLRFWLGPDLNVVVSNPDDLKILLTSPKTSQKGPQYKYMADILGGGILSGSGIVWRRHRKIVTPNYSKRGIKAYTLTFNQEADILIKELGRIPNGVQINIYKYIVKCTTFAVCQTIMGLTREESLKIPRLQEVIDLAPSLYGIIFDRMTKWYLQIDPIFWLTESYRIQKHFLKLMPEFAEYILDKRRSKLSLIDENILDLEDSNIQLSALDRLLVSDELSEKEFQQELFTLFTSSQEASGKICSYLLLMMAFHPKCQEKLYAEINAIIGNDERCVTEEDFKQMPYLDMVYKEVLRLFPIGAMIQRTVVEDIEISTCTVPAGSSLVIPIYHIHRDKRFWNNPEDFDPERFSPENCKLRPPNCYIPFSLGPMDCLGRHFGTKLIKTIAVKVLQHYELISLSTYKDLRLAIKISVFSINGYPVIVMPRQKKA